MAQGKRPNWRILSVSFETTVQDGAARFSVPEGVRKLFKVKRGDHLQISMKTETGTRIPREARVLTSGSELLDARLNPGEKIRVRVSRKTV
jgi:hypothetical protein